MKDMAGMYLTTRSRPLALTTFPSLSMMAPSLTKVRGRMQIRGGKRWPVLPLAILTLVALALGFLLHAVLTGEPLRLRDRDSPQAPPPPKPNPPGPPRAALR